MAPKAQKKLFKRTKSHVNKSECPGSSGKSGRPRGRPKKKPTVRITTKQKEAQDQESQGGPSFAGQMLESNGDQCTEFLERLSAEEEKSVNRFEGQDEGRKIIGELQSCAVPEGMVDVSQDKQVQGGSCSDGQML